jgi:hypothetical protein
LLGYVCQLFRGGAGDWLGEIEQGRIFALTEILRLKKLRQADDLRSSGSRFTDALDGVVQILVRVRGHRHLHQSDAEFLRRQNDTPSGTK